MLAPKDRKESIYTNLFLLGIIIVSGLRVSYPITVAAQLLNLTGFQYFIFLNQSFNDKAYIVLYAKSLTLHIVFFAAFGKMPR